MIARNNTDKKTVKRPQLNSRFGRMGPREEGKQCLLLIAVTFCHHLAFCIIFLCMLYAVSVDLKKR